MNLIPNVLTHKEVNRHHSLVPYKKHIADHSHSQAVEALSLLIVDSTGANLNISITHNSHKKEQESGNE